ncbi:FHA domain-containing protein [Sorangium sp. So ce1036]|uniref:FHA domain-containing protein n=1 Tax=Sorangium sp. So ce1036 TaxID=3133328 RepID=UPI003F0F78E7
MAVLKHEAHGLRVTLPARARVGRVSDCAVRLRDRCASGEHAVLSWDGARWCVRDLGSTNGTHVRGRRLAFAERVPVDAGTELVFGGDAERWVLEEAGPPVASARAEQSGEVREAEQGLLALPDAADPRVTLFEDRHGRWQVEIDGITRPAVDQERVEAGGVWVLRVPPRTADGALPTTASNATTPKFLGVTVLRFEVSQDEEHIALSLVQGARVTQLTERAHHELLLLLARARLGDRDLGLPAAEQGWRFVDELLARLRVDLHHLNVNVFRARRQLARAGVVDAGAVIERRTTTRQLRLGTEAIEVIRS